MGFVRRLGAKPNREERDNSRNDIPGGLDSG
jgi:hypothetical protein